MKVYFGKKSFELKTKETKGFGKFKGLMFRSKNAENLFFEGESLGIWGIHSFFVFFSFLALWLDEKNNVVEWEIVRPFRFSVAPKSGAKRLIELPINKENAKVIDFVVGKRKSPN